MSDLQMVRICQHHDIYDSQGIGYYSCSFLRIDYIDVRGDRCKSFFVPSWVITEGNELQT